MNEVSSLSTRPFKYSITPPAEPLNPGQDKIRPHHGKGAAARPNWISLPCLVSGSWTMSNARSLKHDVLYTIAQSHQGPRHPNTPTKNGRCILDPVKEQLIVAYDRLATTRDATAKAPWKIETRADFFRRLQDQNCHTLLEIGAGPGHDAKFFQDHGLHVRCIDLSAKHVELCREKGLDAHVMDFAHMHFADQSFDAIWALNCLLHVPKAQLPQVLQEIHRVLKPGGLFYMGVYGRQDIEGVWEGDHYEPKRFFSFFHKDTLESLLKRDFLVQSFQILPHLDDLDFQSIVLQRPPSQ